MKMNSSDLSTDPTAIIRRFWAANNILQNPNDLRDWLQLPVDVVSHVLECLEGDSLSSLRLTCSVWNGCVNTHINKLCIGLWPPRPSFLSQFRSLTDFSLSAGSISDPQERSAVVVPLLATLGDLPKLVQLKLTYAGLGSLETLGLLSGLTHLALTNPSVQSRCRSPGGAGGDPDADIEEADLGLAPDGLQLLPQQPPAAAAAAVAAAAAARGDGIDVEMQGSVDSSSGSSGSGSSVVLPVEAGTGSVGQLVKLKQLLLDHMNPDWIALSQLPDLQWLEVKGQTMRVVGSQAQVYNPLPGVGLLTGLKHLVARSNYGINRLPADLGCLSVLQHLDVSKNMLWALPQELMHLSHLSHLDVSSNCLSVIPDDITALAPSLTFLDVSNNSRVGLPSTLGALSNLVQLNISWIWSDLGVLWAGATGLSSLQVLNVVGNGVSELPASVGTFKQLTHFALSMNNLTKLPDSLGCLATLKHLEVSDNRLQTLPVALGRLMGLHSLGLRSNCLTELPEELGRLSGLTFLDASMNHIAVLPDTLTKLTGLHQLALSMNPLLTLPPGMIALQQLRILEMYYVKLQDAPPASQGACKTLQERIPGLYIFSNTMFQYGEELTAVAASDGVALAGGEDDTNTDADTLAATAADAIVAAAAAAAAAEAAAATAAAGGGGTVAELGAADEVESGVVGFEQGLGFESGALGFEQAPGGGAQEEQYNHLALEFEPPAAATAAAAPAAAGMLGFGQHQQQQQQQQQQAGPSRAARAAAGLRVDVTHLTPTQLTPMTTLQVTCHTEEAEGAPGAAAKAAAVAPCSSGLALSQSLGFDSSTSLPFEEGEDLTLLLSPVGFSPSSTCSSVLVSPSEAAAAAALFASPSGSDSSSGSNGRRLGSNGRRNCRRRLSSSSSRVVSETHVSETLEVLGCEMHTEMHTDAVTDAVAEAETAAGTAAAAAAVVSDDNMVAGVEADRLLQSFGSNISISSNSSNDGAGLKSVVSWYEASVRSRRPTLSSSCPCLASANAAAAASAATAAAGPATVAAMAAGQPPAGSNGSSSAGSFHPLPGSWSFDVSLLAAAKLGSHYEGEGEAGDSFPPLPMLPRSKSVGRSLLARFSRGGEASNSPTGLGFRYLQQQQQQQAAAVSVDARQPGSNEPAAAAAAAVGGDVAEAAGSSAGGSAAATAAAAAAAAAADSTRLWQLLRGRRATAYDDC